MLKKQWVFWSEWRHYDDIHFIADHMQCSVCIALFIVWHLTWRKCWCSLYRRSIAVVQWCPNSDVQTTLKFTIRCILVPALSLSAVQVVSHAATCVSVWVRGIRQCIPGGLSRTASSSLWGKCVWLHSAFSSAAAVISPWTSLIFSCLSLAALCFMQCVYYGVFCWSVLLQCYAVQCCESLKHSTPNASPAPKPR